MSAVTPAGSKATRLCAFAAGVSHSATCSRSARSAKNRMFKRRALHHAQPAGLEQRSVVDGFDQRQSLDIALDQIGEPAEDGSASRRPERCPRRGMHRRRLYRASNLVRPGGRHGTESRIVDRTVHGERVCGSDASAAMKWSPETTRSPQRTSDIVKVLGRPSLRRGRVADRGRSRG